MEKSDIKKRLKEYLDCKHLSLRMFAAKCNLSPSNLSRLQETSSQKTMRNIMQHSDLNTTWLMKGVGEMLNKSIGDADLIGGVQGAITEETIAVKYYDINPTASFTEFCSGQDEIPVPIHILPDKDEILDDTYCVFQIAGESMSPQIQPGARVLCKEMPPTKWHSLHDGVIVIAYSDKFVIKRIAANHLQSENYIILASDNPEFPAKETVQLADIRAIFRAKRIISSPIV